MVLADLGGKITGALNKLQTVQIVDEAALDECLKEISLALIQADVNIRYVSELKKNVKQQVVNDEAKAANKRRLVQKGVAEGLVKLLTASKPAYILKKGYPNCILFVGLQGSGKTTTCAKYAHHYKKKGWKVALVCADTFRAGAFDQLKQNATRAKIPFYGSYTEKDPVKIAREGVTLFKKEKYDLIIVDTSGRHKQEQALFDEMAQVSAAVTPDDVIFIMDSHMGQACYDQARAFRDCVSVGSVIITKLDGHAKGGGALSAVSATDSPVVFVGTGEQFDDFEPFEPKGFVSRLMGMGDIAGLLYTIKDSINMDKQPELLQRLSKGIFTIRDMREQFQTVLRLGPLGKVVSMLPGMNADLIPKGQEQEGCAQIKKSLCMMDSMTAAELDCVKPMTESRILRVARGSGCQPWQVEILLEQHKAFSKMVGRMGKAGLGKKGGGDLRALSRNPQQLKQKMEQAVDPRLLKQMGGSQNMMDLMKQFGKMEKDPELKDLVKGLF